MPARAADDQGAPPSWRWVATSLAGAVVMAGGWYIRDTQQMIVDLRHEAADLRTIVASQAVEIAQWSAATSSVAQRLDDVLRIVNGGVR